jgi:hypothetical protein
MPSAMAEQEWIAKRRAEMRADQVLRLIENRFVTSESSFVDMDDWDACVNPNTRPVVADRTLAV